MSKEIRFSELVKKSGHPKTVTLWTDPEKNKDFMKAVRQNRVLTVVQQTHGKDFGEVGFHEQPLALYLVFPKTLPAERGAHVIGLKYELIEEPVVSHPARIVPSKRAVPKPAAKEFDVVIERAALLKTTVHVTAKNQAAAKSQALQMVKEQAFDLPHAELQEKTVSVQEI